MLPEANDHPAIQQLAAARAEMKDLRTRLPLNCSIDTRIPHGVLAKSAQPVVSVYENIYPMFGSAYSPAVIALFESILTGAQG